MKITSKLVALLLTVSMISHLVAAEAEQGVDSVAISKNSTRVQQEQTQTQETVERTLCIIKPNVASKTEIVQEINNMIEKAGLKIVASKEMTLSFDQAKEFYREHEGKPFFNDLCSFMSSRKVIVQVLEGDNAIQTYRDLMGSTNPANARPGTIRRKFAESVEANAVHGSDKKESAKREITFFFPEVIS